MPIQRRAVARGEEKFRIWLLGRRSPFRQLQRDGPDAIETKQTEFRAQPEITVRRLGNCVDGAFGKAFADVHALCAY